MTRRKRKSKHRQASAKHRNKPPPAHQRRRRRNGAFSARLTIDVTPDLRARIKITAFERGVTVAYMLRNLLLRTYPRTKGKRR